MLIQPHDLSPEVVDRIEAFAPRFTSDPDFAEITRFTQDTVRRSRPVSENMAAQRLTNLASLARWCTTVGIPLTVEMALHPSTIDRYIESAQIATKGARTRRTILKRLGRVVAPSLYPAQARPIGRPRRLTGYTDKEIAAFLGLAAAQPTARLRDRLTAIIALGAGAGLRAREIQGVLTSDLAQTESGLIVHVGRGKYPRTVPVRRSLQAPASEVYARYADRALFPGGVRMPSNAIRDLSGGKDLPRIEFIRLRATWLTEIQRGLGMKEFLHAAGVNDPRDFYDYVRDDPIPSFEQIEQVLRGAESREAR